MSKTVVAVAAVAALTFAPAASAAVTPAFTLESKSVWGAAQPLVGTSIYTPPVNEGGWSAFAPIDDSTFWTVSDRGPNGLPAVGGTGTRRTFLSPSFTPTIYKVAIGSGGALNVVQRIPIHLKAGAVNPARAWMQANPNPGLGVLPGDQNHITGLSQIATAGQGGISGLPTAASARDEVPYAADGTTPLPSDPYGLDSESIAVDPRDGSFWIGDEYRPSLVHVAADGTLLNRIVPDGVTVPADPANPAKFAGEDEAVVKTHRILPRAFAFRRQNRGMEGGTLTADGKTLFGMLQSSIVPPAGQGDGRTLRLVRFDVSDSLNPKLTGEWIYRLSAPQPGSGINQADLSNSDIYALDATHIIVDEHDNVTSVPGAGEKRVYAIDLEGATNLVDDAVQNGNAPTLESTNGAGVTPVAKTFWLSLDDWGYDHDKPEGLGLFPNGDLAMLDDNDFGFEQGNDPAATSTPPFKVSASGKTTELWRYDVSNLVEATVGGSVPATLSLTLGAPATFGAFTPGVTRDYTATTAANVISTAGDATLSVSDPGHLTNGAFSLPSPLGVAFSKSRWTAPTANEPVTITFSQHVDAGDALRTGAYSKTLTFTLSTTTP
ncbi:esterase-like activity of phytase family protein [Solirubrobacter taibaiensis]|nr:esterase-like activity of phytase family protein [Solirubrobacter taibaiensis]